LAPRVRARWGHLVFGVKIYSRKCREL
jgi:hypothetical protein